MSVHPENRTPTRAIGFTAAMLMMTVGGGCGAPSSDPRSGGLVGGIHGISTGAYEQRLVDRQAEIADLDAAGQALEARSASSKSKLARVERSISERRARILKLKADIAEIERRLSVGDAGNQAALKVLTSIEAENASLESSAAPLKAEFAKLNGVINELEREHEAEVLAYYQRKRGAPPGDTGAPKTVIAGGELDQDLESRTVAFDKRVQEIEQKLARVRDETKQKNPS